MKKNIRATHFKKMAEIQERRWHSENKQTRFAVNGRPVSPMRIERALNRQTGARPVSRTHYFGFLKFIYSDKRAVVHTPLSLEYWTPGNSHRETSNQIDVSCTSLTSTSIQSAPLGLSTAPLYSYVFNTTDLEPAWEAPSSGSNTNSHRMEFLFLTDEEGSTWQQCFQQIVTRKDAAKLQFAGITPEGKHLYFIYLIVLITNIYDIAIQSRLCKAIAEDDTESIYSVLSFLYFNADSFATRCPALEEVVLFAGKLSIPYYCFILSGLRFNYRPIFSSCDWKDLNGAQEAFHNNTSLLTYCTDEQCLFLHRISIITDSGAAQAVTDALLQGNIQIVQCYAERFDRVHYLDYIVRKAPKVREAIAQNPASMEAMLILLECGFKDKATPGCSYLALLVAAQLLLKDQVDWMLHAGAKVNEQSQSGSSFLHILAGLLHLNVLPIAEIFIRHGINVHLVDKLGNTCLHTAFHHGRNVWTQGFADLLLNAGVNVNAQNSIGDTCLQVGITHYFYKSMHSFDLRERHAADLAFLTQWFESKGGNTKIKDVTGEDAAKSLQEMDYIFAHPQDVIYALEYFAEEYEPCNKASNPSSSFESVY